MDRQVIRTAVTVVAALLATGWAIDAPQARGQSARRLARNTATGRLEPVRETTLRAPQRRAAQPRLTMPAPTVSDALIDESLQLASYVDAPCDDLYCDIGCGDAVCGVPDDCATCGIPDDCGCDPCQPCAPHRCGGWFGGFEAVMVQPRYGSNEAYTTMNADGASFESFSTTEFDYGLEFSPRVFAGWQNSEGVGVRAAWWQFDNGAATASTSPPANGLGSITHPALGGVDISSSAATDVFAAAADLDVYAIDLEFTKTKSFRVWDIGVGCGFRYASVEQSYRAAVTDAADAELGSIDYSHKLDGYGPTVSLDAYRRFFSDAGVFCKARGSALFGEGSSRLLAVEDATLTSALTTTRTTYRDDLLPVGELQVGFRWEGAPRRGQVFRPLLSLAMEGQVWHGAGNASSEDGALGFYGFNAGAGLNW